VNADEDEEEADDSAGILPSIECAPDDRPGPESILLQAEQDALQRDWTEKAYQAVDDPRHLQAVLLHCVHGWPISSTDPKTPDLARFFDTQPRRIKYWIAKALGQMRAAIGEQR
jgi:hypothetical protein